MEIYTKKIHFIVAENNQNVENNNNAVDDKASNAFSNNTNLNKEKQKMNETPVLKESKTGFSNKTKTSKSKNSQSKLSVSRKTKTNFEENKIEEKTSDEDNSNTNTNSTFGEEQLLKVNDKLKISLGEQVVFNIKFTPSKLGRFKSSVVFQLDDGISFDIDILANIIGPELAINTPLIDFGLFATSTVQKKEFEIENLSPIKVQYLIKESRYKNINFDN